MSGETDLALRVIVAKPFAEVVGAVLMDRLGPFAEEQVGPQPVGPEAGGDETRAAADKVALVFYPGAEKAPTDAQLLALLSEEARASGLVRVERRAVPRDWVNGWKNHFRPIVIGRVRVRPSWELPLEGAAPDGAARGAAAAGTASDAGPLVEVVINPGLGFGTGLHATTRGVLRLLQEGEPRGPLVDSGTGSGILAIAAAKLGWGPVVAFDNDPVALISARENVAANGVAHLVGLHEVGFAEAAPAWFVQATVLANMTLEPVLGLLRKLAVDAVPWTGATLRGRPRRLVVSGLLAGAQEQELVCEAEQCGFSLGRRSYETEWVTMELLPAAPQSAAAPGADVPAGGTAPGAPGGAASDEGA